MNSSESAAAAASLPGTLKLRAGHTEVKANAGRAELLAMVEQSNRKARLDGLPDQFDSEIIDPEKAAAFVAALGRLPQATLRSLDSRTLLLNYPDLLIGASAPTRPASFNGAFQLEIADVQGDVVLARSRVEIDCELARQRAGEAKSRLHSAEDEVRALESQLSSAGDAKERGILGSLTAARLRRFALAQVWQQNARWWAQCPGADPGAKEGLEAASRAVDSYAVQRGGMP